MAASIMAVCNQKGGVGKTTTTFHLARAAVLAGHRVLLVDLDPQGNLTRIAAREPVPKRQAGLADVLSERSDLELADVVVEGRWPGLTVVPTSGTSLAGVRNELVIAGAGREHRLEAALAPVAGDYDLILLDCPPSLDLLTVNGLTAAAEALVIVEASLFAADGLSALMETIATVRRSYNPRLKMRGAIANDYEGGTVGGAEWLAALQSKTTILAPVIPHRVVIKDASEAGVGLDEWNTTRGRLTARIYDEHIANLMGVRHGAA